MMAYLLDGLTSATRASNACFNGVVVDVEEVWVAGQHRR